MPVAGADDASQPALDRASASATARTAAAKRQKRDVHGWIVLDKPVGMTSTHAVVGHQASVCGQARRPCRHARSAGFGLPADRARRSDQDRAVRRRWPQDLSLHHPLGRGARHRRCRGPRRRRPATCGPMPARSRALLPRFTGTIEQVPPRFSAIKIDGERAYDLARDGEMVELAAPPGRRSTALELVEMPDPDHAVLTAECGKGTYVRSLARDLGRALGAFGHVSALRRSRVGPFGEADMISLEQLEALCHRAGRGEGTPRRRAPADRDRAGRHPGAGREPGRRGKAPQGPSRFIARTGRFLSSAAWSRYAAGDHLWPLPKSTAARSSPGACLIWPASLVEPAEERYNDDVDYDRA